MSTFVSMPVAYPLALPGAYAGGIPDGIAAGYARYVTELRPSLTHSRYGSSVTRTRNGG